MLIGDLLFFIYLFFFQKCRELYTFLLLVNMTSLTKEIITTHLLSVCHLLIDGNPSAILSGFSVFLYLVVFFSVAHAFHPTGIMQISSILAPSTV